MSSKVDEIVAKNQEDILDGVVVIREGTDIGVECFDCDLTPQGHRIQITFGDDGTMTITTVHGPKCNCHPGIEPGDPIDVMCLSSQQVDHVIRYGLPVNRLPDVVAAVARCIRDGRMSPEELTMAAIGEIIGVCDKSLLKAYMSEDDA